MSQFSESQLKLLQSRLLPFGADWTRRTGRQLATVRDGIDFLASMKSREEFWRALAPQEPAEAASIDLGALRALLPTGTLGSDVSVEDYLRSIGLSEDEIRAVVSDLDEPASLESAIRSAFAEGRAQSIARSLERILETSNEVLATQRYVSRLATKRGVARTVSVMMGIALFLIGAACGQTESPPTPVQQPTTATAPTPTPEPSPTPTPNPTPTPPPQPAQDPVTPTPAPDQNPVRPPRAPRPNMPPDPAPLYKGVSPRRRGANPS